MLGLWSACALAFAALPEGSAGRHVAANAAYGTAAVFALASAIRAARLGSGAGRRFWLLFGAGLALGFVGDLFVWPALQEPPSEVRGFPFGHAVYLASYLVLFAALAVLVHARTRRITSTVMLDAAAVMLSTGTLAWYFLFGRLAEDVGPTPAVLASFSWPLFDAALLFLSLVALSAGGRPLFLRLLPAGFLLFAAADVLYLVSWMGESYRNAGWPDMLWALGLVAFGTAALGADEGRLGRGEPIAPWRQLAFWLGPLSPPLHLAVVLAAGALRPPLGAYVLVCGAVLSLYLAVRTGWVSFAVRRLSDEGKEAARTTESARLLRELHDTVKGNAHGVSLVLRAAREADRRGDRAEVRALLEKALQLSRETEFMASRPYEEIQAAETDGPLGPTEYLRHRLARFQEYFGVVVHDDLQAPLDELGPAEVAAVYRIVTEAFQNVAKHSGARNLWLGSRRVGSTLLVRIRDDGRGFDADAPPPGMGLRYMRHRAREVGAKLDVISSPGAGTTVQIRFERR